MSEIVTRRGCGVFGGRVIFDHIAKTGGQAVNAWMKDALGPGIVTENLSGEHRQLIRLWGGTHSVISAHVTFDGTGLDPRYDYVTCVREPIDRALSWLYYFLNNPQPKMLDPWLREDVRVFVESDGQVAGRVLPFVANHQSRHFLSIIGPADKISEVGLDLALRMVRSYAVWGLYERFPTFLADTAALFDVEGPGQIAEVNVTWQRPDPSAVPAALIGRLTELNAVDLEFYRNLRAFCA